MPATGRRSGMPASIIASEVPQTVAIEDEPFELGDLRDDADGVGEALAIREHGVNRPPGKLAVTDLAPSRPHHAADLSHRIRREVVMQEEGLLVGPLQRIDILLVLAGAERRHHQCLRLAAGEERAAMRAWQQPDLADDRTHGAEVAPVDAVLGGEDRGADHVALGVLEGRGELAGKLRIVEIRRQSVNGLDLDFGDAVAPLMLGGDLVGFAQIGFGDAAHLGGQFLAARVDLHVPRLLGGALGELDDGLDHRLEMLLAVHHGAEHHVLRQLLGLGLDHEHGALGAGHDEVERAFAHLVDHRVQHIFAADIADPRRGDRAAEGNAREGQRRRGGDHADDVRIVLHIVGENRDDHLRLVSEAVDE